MDLAAFDLLRARRSRERDPLRPPERITMTRPLPVLFALLLFAAAAPPLSAQTPADPDRRPNLAEPDFNLVALPTTLRLPLYKSSFRVTHRFGRPLGQGSFGDLASDLFGLDAGALIGLEYRFGIAPGAQVGIHRTSNRTIELFGQYDVLQNTERRPLNLAILFTVDGTNNFRDRYSPAVGAALSYSFGNHGALYVEPMWVHNANLIPSPLTSFETNTTMIGLGARLRIRPTVYVVAEVTPRLAGYDLGTHQGSFAIEKRMGGHLFQLNFSNGFGTTMGQIARGAASSDDWFLGFNISRKFF
jgi:hypothetical protein